MAKKKTERSSKIERRQEIIAGVPAVILIDEARILRAPLLKNENTRGGEVYHVASIADMEDYGYLNTPKKQIRVKANGAKAEKYHLEPHDVLLTIVGTIGKISIVPESFDGKCIPTSNMLIIRFRETKPEKALAFTMFMKSEYGRAILVKLTHGKTIPIISKKAFSKTLIPALTAVVKKESKALFSKEEKLYQKREELVLQAEELRKGYLKG
jgi:restriction endonuclease S subunit